MKCPNCGNEAQPDAVFCDQCGTRLVPAAQPVVAASAPAPTAEAAPSVATAAPAAAPIAPAPPAASAAPATVGTSCPKCGGSVTPGELFCGECGAPLSAPQPEPTAVAAAAAQAAAAPTPVPVGPGQAHPCPACGAIVAANDEYCYACGADLRARPAPAAATVPVATVPVVTVAPAAAAAPAASVVAPAALAQPAPAQGSVPAPVAAPAPPNTCPACAAKVAPGDAFCPYCGAAMAGQPTPSAAPVAAQAAPVAAAAPVAPVAAVTARLVLVTSGIEIPLAPGKEVIVGREDPYSGIVPDVDLTPHGAEEGGVSRRHFKISLAGGQYVIEDLNSTNFTLLNRQRLQPGKPAPLADGDEIRAGRVRLTFRVS